VSHGLEFDRKMFRVFDIWGAMRSGSHVHNFRWFLWGCGYARQNCGVRVLITMWDLCVFSYTLSLLCF